jgi:parallel beta-helix repeat protein
VARRTWVCLVGGTSAIFAALAAAGCYCSGCGLSGPISATAKSLPETTLSPENCIITRSVRVKPARYDMPDPRHEGAVTIAADDVVVDFQGAVISAGEGVESRLDQLEGCGIVVRGRRNVTIRNVVVRGYRFNVCVTGGEHVRIEDSDVSYSRGHRISDRGAPLDRWLSIRNVDDWRSYGAGIWLESARAAVVRHCRGGNAQNGIVLAFSDHCEVTDNDFSFNSGWGIALYGSCDNVVSWNLADFCDRPWAGSLGADAASLAISAGSHRNNIVGNSLTHGGDGFFLTNITDTGYDPGRRQLKPQGASNDNVIAFNDGSWSPGNAFEGTFSLRNVYYKNGANYSGYGFWLGYSRDSLLLDNEISHNRFDGIAIEQGLGTRVESNHIFGNGGAGVRLWATRDAVHDRFPSADLEIRENIIHNSPTAIDLTNSTDYYVGENQLKDAPLPSGLRATKLKSPSTALKRFLASGEYRRLQEIMATRPKNYRFYAETGGPQGREWTEMEAFAPRDFRKDLAAVRRISDGAVELFLPEPGATRVAVPEWAALMPDPADLHRLRVELADSAAAVAVIHPCPINLSCGDRHQVITRNLVSGEWKLKWFDWDRGGEPLSSDDAAGWNRLFAGQPLAETTSRELGPGGDGAPVPGLTTGRYALLATRRLKLPTSKYRFRATFDGGLRLRVDGREVYANWGPNRARFMDVEVELAESEHELEVRYCHESRHAVLIWYWGELPDQR